MIRSLLLMLATLCGLNNLISIPNDTPASLPSQVNTPPILEFVDYQRLDGVGDTRDMTISPDASMLVWPQDTDFCIYQIPTETTDCVETGDMPLRGMTGFRWSLDSRYIAFHEDVFVRMVESDLWVFDVEARQLVNLTDDDIDGQFITSEGITANVDYSPVWGPDDTLYFFRTVYDQNLVPVPLSLERIALGNGLEHAGTPELVTDLTSWAQGEKFPVYRSRSDVLNSTASLSPDGQLMALIVRPSELDLGQSIWILDIASGDLRQIATLPELLQTGVPTWEEGEEIGLSGLGWSGDGQTLTVGTYNGSYAGSVVPVYAVNVNTGESIPLLDFSGLPNRASLYQLTPSDGFAGAYDFMRIGLVTPDGSYVVYFNFGGDVPGVSALPLLPPATNTPIRLFSLPAGEYGSDPMPMIQPSVGDDGEYVRVLMNGYMLTFAKR
ncbi:MAG: hypothetical protein HY862_22125 [Chloroflexi bacterium]|nr:hypothetical protein [Chloroflexota bacterium]